MSDAAGSRSRYPGTRPFSDSSDDIARFFGRDAEADELYLRVLSVPLLLQFGNSGLGKTSLLQAGLFPRLRQKPFLPVMVRLNNGEESLTAAVARAIGESCRSEGIEPAHRSSEGLWELLATTTVWRDDLLLTLVLVFDQFEEVFTLRDAAFRAELAAELGALVSGIAPARVQGHSRPAVRVVISLREDYLGALEEFSVAMPGLFGERLRLGPLTEEAARDAIAGPAQLTAPDLSPPFTIEPAALDVMIAELKGKSGVIEPFQLQLLARHAELVAARKGAAPRLTPEDFRGTHDFASVLENFYRDTLHRIAPRAQRVKAQRLVEEGLLGASGHRLMLEEGQIRSDYGVTPETLQVLEGSRLVHRERRLESVFYEISHDRLADSIFRRRTTKLPRKVRQALWAAAFVALLVVAGLVMFNRRVSHERDAAERWLSVLLGEEFFGELRDSGRTTVSERLQGQIAGAGLGSALTRGLALRNRGDLQRLDGTLPDALASFRAALTELERAPRDVVVKRELARTHERLGEALSQQQGKLAEALPHYDSALALWHDVVKQKAPLVNDDCMGLAESLTAAANLNVPAGRIAAALQHADEAFSIAFGASFDTPDRCGARPGTVQPDPDVRSLRVLAMVALVHHRISADAEGVDGAAILATHAKDLRPPSIRASGLALTALLERGISRNAPVEEYRRILEDLRAIQRWDADKRTWQHNRASMQTLIAQTLIACTSSGTGCSPDVLDEAEMKVTEAKAVLRTLGASDPTDLALRRDLLWALRVHGAVLAARGPAFASESMAQLDEANRLVAQGWDDGSPAGQPAAGTDRSAQDLGDGIQQRLNADALLATDPAAALRALHASEAALRASLRRRPAHAAGYFQLIETYIGMSWAYEKLGRPEEQLYALAGATTAAQLARWLAPPSRIRDANESLLATRYALSSKLVAQKRPSEALPVLEQIMSLGQEFLAEPAPDGRAFGILGDAQCGIARIQRDLGQAGWRETLRGGLIYLRKAATLDPAQEKKLRHWEAYASSAT